MRLSAHQRDVLDVLPSQVHRVLRQSFRDHSHQHRSKVWAKRAEASRRSARDAVLEYGKACDVYSESLERNLQSCGISGAYPDPEEAWDALSEGAKHSFIGAMCKRDANEHALSLSLRLLDSMAGDQGDAR